MAKVKIEVEVEVIPVSGKNPEKDDDAFEFVNIKCPGQQANMLPRDVPAPRRLSRDLAREAGIMLTPALKAKRDAEVAAALKAKSGVEPEPLRDE